MPLTRPLHAGGCSELAGACLLIFRTISQMLIAPKTRLKIPVYSALFRIIPGQILHRRMKNLQICKFGMPNDDMKSEKLSAHYGSYVYGLHLQSDSLSPPSRAAGCLRSSAPSARNHDLSRPPFAALSPDGKPST